MQLQPVRIEEATALHAEFLLETSGQNRFQYTLIARFVGEYRNGSAGRPDAAYILGVTRMAVEIWHPAACLLDLSQLRYNWGDQMEWLLPPDVGCKTAVVVGPWCAHAIATLLWGISTTKPATDADFIFDNLPAAWEAVRYRPES